MPELLSYDEDAREAVTDVEILLKGRRPMTVLEAEDYVIRFQEPWPICGDELTKRGMK